MRFDALSLSLRCLSIAALAATATGAGAQTRGAALPWRPTAQDESPNCCSAATSVTMSASVKPTWPRFVARELTPRFPDGLTVTDAIGQWRDRDSGSIVREPSKHVEIVLPGNADDEARLDAVVAAYKRAFHQQSVGVIVHTACVAF